MRTANLLRLGIFLTIPSIVLSCASLVIVGGLYRDAVASYKSERDQVEKLSELVVSTSRQMRQGQAEMNGALDNRFSAAMSLVAIRLDAVERATKIPKAKPDTKVRSVSALQ